MLKKVEVAILSFHITGRAHHHDSMAKNSV